MAEARRGTKRGITSPQTVIAIFATIGIGAFVLWILFGSINYVKSEMQQAGVNFTAPGTLEQGVQTAGNFAGIGLILLAVVALVSVVGSLIYVFGRGT